jgi:hypothetical protein
MEIEHDVKVIPISDQFQAELEKLQAEGWTIAPGVTPIAVYHLVRAKQAPLSGGAAFGKMHIDDSKVFVLKPDGSLVRPDGSVIKPGELQ